MQEPEYKQYELFLSNGDHVYILSEIQNLETFQSEIAADQTRIFTVSDKSKILINNTSDIIAVKGE